VTQRLICPRPRHKGSITRRRRGVPGAERGSRAPRTSTAGDDVQPAARGAS